jgi:hypothetical protein
MVAGLWGFPFLPCTRDTRDPLPVGPGGPGFAVRAGAHNAQSGDNALSVCFAGKSIVLNSAFKRAGGGIRCTFTIARGPHRGAFLKYILNVQSPYLALAKSSAVSVICRGDASTHLKRFSVLVREFADDAISAAAKGPPPAGQARIAHDLDRRRRDHNCVGVM